MAISFTDHFGVDRVGFEATGAFDPILDVDSRLFIDPFLLKGTSAFELQGSYDAIHTWFSDTLKIIALSKRPNDYWWQQANQRLSFHEVQGLCIGYSSKGTGGAGMGKQKRGTLLSIAKEILDAGIEDPTIFELVGLLQEGVGSDLISDMVARIILDDLLHYSIRVFQHFGIPTHSPYTLGDRVYQMATNPFNGRSVILVPRDILRNLPIARDWSDIDTVSIANRLLREQFNRSIGTTWKQAVNRLSKSDLRELLLKNPELFQGFIDAYKKKEPVTYDFSRDPSGEVIWYPAAKRYTREFPLSLFLTANPAPDEVLGVIVAICDKFKDLVENNDLSSLLYDGSKPKHESAAQKLFYGIADSYCSASNLDLTRESDAGRGPVDFKFSRGYNSRVVVEAKLTTNKNLVHGYETQVAEYRKAEKTHHSVYLVIDVLGGSEGLIQRLHRRIALESENEEQKPVVIFVDAKPKASASKYKPK